MPTDKWSYQNKQVGNAYSQSLGRSSADTTNLKRRFTDWPTHAQSFQKTDRTLEYRTPSWIDDIIVVTRGDRQEHEKKLFDVLNKLVRAGYRARKRKSEYFMKRTKWRRHELDENGRKPNEEKREAILKLKSPNNTKEWKSFLCAIQFLANSLPKFSEKTDRPRKLLKKMNHGNGKRNEKKRFYK